jgi:D-arabinose 1-dehydrogenase-like Zn-dependent alcohol dehydrogenase
MGLHVVALDVTEDKLALARNLGADSPWTDVRPMRQHK